MSKSWSGAWLALPDRTPTALTAVVLLVVHMTLFVVSASAHGPGDYQADLRKVQVLVQRGALAEALGILQHVEEEAPYEDIVGRATFWRAFILLRMGDDRSVGEALDAATKLIDEMPEVAIEMETPALLDRLRKSLAEMGDLFGVSDVDALAEKLEDLMAKDEEGSP